MAAECHEYSIAFAYAIATVATGTQITDRKQTPPHKTERSLLLLAPPPIGRPISVGVPKGRLPFYLMNMVDSIPFATDPRSMEPAK